MREKRAGPCDLRLRRGVCTVITVARAHDAASVIERKDAVGHRAHRQPLEPGSEVEVSEQAGRHALADGGRGSPNEETELAPGDHACVVVAREVLRLVMAVKAEPPFVSVREPFARIRPRRDAGKIDVIVRVDEAGREHVRGTTNDANVAGMQPASGSDTGNAPIRANAHAPVRLDPARCEHDRLDQKTSDVSAMHAAGSGCRSPRFGSPEYQQEQCER